MDRSAELELTPDEIYRRVKETVTADSSAVFVACTQLRALEVVELLERDLGKPVYSANQASAWLAYEALRIDPKILDRGSLLRSLSERSLPPSRAVRRTA